MNTSAAIPGLLLLSFSLLLPPSLWSQGQLTPPAGPPAPTMKTLVEVEPRTNLQATPAPAGVVTTDANYHFIINQPGSYYLSANLGVTKPNGIQINAEGVTLDLNGFQISRASGSGGNGIEVAATSHRASVRHGSLKGFAYGIQSLFSTIYARACGFRDLSVSNCTTYGIFAGDGAVLESCRAHDNSATGGIRAGGGSSLTNCTAFDNTGSYGIWASAGSSLTNCTATNNTVTYGIFASVGSSLINCAVYSNTSAASASAGIATGSGCTINGCSVYLSASTGSSTPTTGMGFRTLGGCTIVDCVAMGNEGDGFNISDGTVARGNTCDSNGSNGDGAGIHATGDDNRIEGNNVTGNDRGIDVDVAGNFIIKNSASGNATNWDVVAGNVILVVNAVTAAAVTGNSGGTAPGSTDPNANFTY